MLNDLEKNRPSPRIECDICIVGAGVAGITLARKLRGQGRRIALLESGGADFERKVQDLAAGEISGREYYPLEDSRLRLFGGTTVVWGGRCAELDEEDFMRRDWVPGSGWPISKDDLRPYYAEAREHLELPQIEDNTCPLVPDPELPGGLRRAFWQFDESFDRFALRNCSDLVRAEDVVIHLHASVTNIHLDASGQRAEGVSVRNHSGAETVFRAAVVVLATGGLENPRLLLASRDHFPAGIGNSGGQVGRCFMEHPHARGVRVATDKPARVFQAFPRFLHDGQCRYGALFRPSAELQREKQILNTAFSIAIRRHAGEKMSTYGRLYGDLRHQIAPTNSGRLLWRTTRRISRMTKKNIGRAVEFARLKNPGKFGVYAVLRAEQAPRPESIVTLGEKRDELGVPRLDLHWQLGKLEKHTARELFTAFDQVLREKGLGTIEWPDWLSGGETWKFDPLVSSHAIGGYHHMGTTRMSASPAEGVVDRHCAVHGIDNLYVAGSSVFPTSGWANPTPTIMALALRMGERIAATWSRPAQVCS